LTDAESVPASVAVATFSAHIHLSLLKIWMKRSRSLREEASNLQEDKPQCRSPGGMHQRNYNKSRTNVNHLNLAT
jgi:hypothetical protein